MAETQKDRLNRRLKALRNERSSWESHWRDLAEYFLPRKGRWLFNNVNRGDKRNQSIIDSTTRIAARTLASGMMAGLTSPARPWFRLTTPDPEMMEFGPVKNWLWMVEARMRDVFSKSNLYNALPTNYGELGVFGTAAMSVEEDSQDIIRCYPYTIGSYYLAQNERQAVDSIYREMNMTVRNLAQKFGEEKLQPQTRSMFQSGNLEQWIKVVHAVEPNTDRDTRKADNRNFPYRSVWWEVGGNDDLFLREAGFREFPVMAPRWEPTAEDIYGASPGMDALGDAKALQLQQKRKAQAIDKVVDPPLVADSAVRGRVSGIPGEITYTGMQPGSGKPGVAPLYEIRPDINALVMDIQEMQDRINRVFYADLFLMLAMSDRRQMTATEVAERHEEKLLMLGPVLERLNDELLDPLIDRTFGIMMRNGLLPEPPQELEGVDLKVEYISILAQAQRMVGLSGIDRLWQFAGSVAAAQPSVLDKLDADQSVDEYGEMLGTPPGVIRSDDDVAKIRQRRAAEERAAQLAEATPQAAETAKTLSETDVESDSALRRMLTGV